MIEPWNADMVFYIVSGRFYAFQRIRFAEKGIRVIFVCKMIKCKTLYLYIL